MKNFISPCNHAESRFTGSTIETMIDRSKSLGVEYFACTDPGSLNSILKGYAYAKKRDIKFIAGIEIFFRDDSCDIARGTESEKIKYFKLLIHFKDQAAYQTLVSMSSDSKRRTVTLGQGKEAESFPLFDWSDLEKISKTNVSVCTSNIEGMVSKHLLVDRPDLSVKYYEKLRNMFGAENFYPTIVPYNHDQYWNAIIEINLGVKKVYIPANDRVETNIGSKHKAIELTYRMTKHKELRAVNINNVRYPVAAGFQNITKAKLLKEFQDLPSDVQTRANKLIKALAEKYGDTERLLINNNSYYAKEDDKVVQDMKLGEEMRVAQKQFIRGTDDIIEYCQMSMGMDLGDIEAMILNSEIWASNFKDFELKYDYKLVDYQGTSEEKMMAIIKKIGRMKWKDPVYLKQFREEHDLLINNGVLNLVPYFLPIVDVFDHYRENGRLVGPARGSAGGFLISYLMGVTQIDPIKYGLYSSRFLTIGRIQQGNLPDIDVDLESRTLLVGKDGNGGYLKEKYGNRAAQCSTRTLLRLKSAILDANRYMNKGKVEAEIQALSKSLPATPQGISDKDFVFGYENNGNHEMGLIELNADLKKYSEDRPEEWDLVTRALSLARQYSRHACAFVIAATPIEDTVPVKEVGGVKRVTGPEHKQCEQAGLTKYDFLTVSAVKDNRICVDYINAKHKPERFSGEPIGWVHSESESAGCFKCHPEDKERMDEQVDLYYGDEEGWSKDMVCDTCNKVMTNKMETGYFMHKGVKTYIWDLPEDPEVFKMLGDGHTETVFQLNTQSVTPVVKQVRPNNITDCATITSLVRPGPLDFIDEKTGRNMVQEFIERKFGRSVSDIPILMELIPETYGVLVFQEQVTKVARELAGMTVEESEDVRIAMGKKKIKLLNSLKPIFVKGAMEKVDQETAEKIWDMMATFARYGFNKAHAVAYSVISYACAFMKYHYPLEWWAAVLTNAKDKEINEVFYKYVKDMVLPPDINLSDEEIIIDYPQGKLRNKLSMIAGLGAKAAEKIIAARPYKDITDFVDKKVSGPALTKKLIHVGVLDSLFKEGASLDFKMNEYEIAISQREFNKKLVDYDATITKRTMEGDKKGADRTVKNKATFLEKGPKDPVIDEKYNLLSPKQDFLLKKAVFPSMNLDLKLALSKGSKIPQLNSGRFNTIQNKWGKQTPVFTGELLQTIDDNPVQQDVYCCVPAYVMSVEEFTYQGTKTALKMILDSSGYISEKVLWPDYNSGELIYPEELKKGAIAWFFYQKKPGKPYNNISQIIIEEESIL